MVDRGAGDPAPETLLHGLRAAGLEVQFERGAWVCCLVVEEGAAWTGRGLDDERALLDVLRRMVPSARLRSILLDGWAAAAPARETASVAEPAVAYRAAAPAREEPAETEPAPEEPALPAGPAPPENGALAAPRPRAPVSPPPERAAAAESERAPAPSMTREAALAAVDALLDDVRAMHGEVAQLARRPMRLTLLGWIAAGRAIQDRVPRDMVVSERVHELAKEVERYAKLYWPGTVPALQRYASPGSCRWLLDTAHEPSRWDEVAEIAERSVLEEEQDPSRDEEGWADAASLRPRPRAPEALLDEVVGRLGKLGAAWGGGVPPHEALDPQAELGAELVALAGRLRWLRGAVLRPDRWGEAMGELRRLADRSGPERSRLALVLDEGYRPPSGTWARELGHDPEEKERRRVRRELLQHRPENASESEELAEWLARAFAVMTNPEIAAVLRAQADAVAGVSADSMGDRRSRARLKRLQELLASGVTDPAREGELRQELAGSGVGRPAAAATDAEEAGAPTLDPEAELRLRVLPHVRGRRLLFVGNRADPNLESALEAGLEPAALDWLVADPRRESAAADRIASGRYDLVLCATGFVSHSTELALRAACRGARVPYVRVYKGRLASCLRALDRDLGLWSEPAAAQGAGR